MTDHDPLGEVGAAGVDPPERKEPAMTSTDGLIAEIADRGLLIGGEWDARSSGGTYAHHNPATGRVQAEVPLAGVADVDRAVAAAADAFPAWRDLPADARAGLLFRLADLLEANAERAAVVGALENGTPVAGLGSGIYAAQWTRYYGGWVDKLDGQVVPVYPTTGLNYIRPEPYGVVGLLVPWNGPMAGMGQKAAAALAAGNTVVVKPSELAPFGAYEYAALALEAGFPPGVVNVVCGGPEAGEALVRHPQVAKVSLTGGLLAARKVMTAAAQTLKPLALELGGKSANIIFDDADLSQAIPIAASLGVVVLSGQGCALPTRVYAHDSVYDEVVDGIVEMVRATPIGDPLDPGTAMGPVITEQACERILATIDRAQQEGAGRLLTGGSRLGGDLADGYFVEPTVFGEVAQESDLARHEIFGPVLSVMRFSGDREVVDKANDSEFGLAAYVHTRDSQRAIEVAHALDAGYVNVNGFAAMSPTAPFGGYKASGFGREGVAPASTSTCAPRTSSSAWVARWRSPAERPDGQPVVCSLPTSAARSPGVRLVARIRCAVAASTPRISGCDRCAPMICSTAGASPAAIASISARCSASAARRSARSGVAPGDTRSGKAWSCASQSHSTVEKTASIVWLPQPSTRTRWTSRMARS